MVRSKYLIYLLLLSCLFGAKYLAVLDLEPIGLSETEAKVLTQRLTSKMIELSDYIVVERANIDKILKEQKFQNSGCTDSECAVEIGQLLNVDVSVIGTVSKFGTIWSLDARLIDVGLGKSLISAEFSREGEINILLTSGITSIANQLCELEDVPTSLVENKPKAAKVKNKSYRKPYSLADIIFGVGKQSVNEEVSPPINESSKFSHCFESVYFMPVYAKTERDNKGEILGTKGIGMWPGYYKKNYYKPVELNKWNSYWHWGTAFLFLPWVGIGTDYVAEDGVKSGVNTIYIFPSFSMGKYYNNIENQRKWYVSLIGASAPSMNTGTNEIRILLRYNNIQLVTGSINQNWAESKEIQSNLTGIGIHHHIKKYKKWTFSHNFLVSQINDVSSENGPQSLILVDMNFELESIKFWGLGLRTNIGFRIQENSTLIDSEAYRKLHSVIDASGLYASFSFLLLTFGS
jgi:hypothetical protein